MSPEITSPKTHKQKKYNDTKVTPKQYNVVFVWNGARKPDPSKIKAAAIHPEIEIAWMHVATLNEAIVMLRNFNCVQYFHTQGVPSNALAFLGGKVL